MKQAIGHHEFATAHHEIETSSDRSFGFVFTGALSLLAAYLAWKGSAWWPLPLPPPARCGLLTTAGAALT